ncbi:MAG: hypothetical protein A3G34_17465 [Candidatus Lindowbacteria bacterium RIFCSPLOWO2_12_FULL_62_27]|nr:MAG: hypothetical protein A3G34_17465 [Candidatus Lindowbacteria bacterium RIFCSPLOWO2_12_FULL_62_27]
MDNFSCLNSKEEVLTKALQLVTSAKDQINAIGQDMSWLKNEPFAKAISTRAINNHELKIRFIITDIEFFKQVGTDTAKAHAEKIGALIRYKPFGTARYISVDEGSKFIVAFGSSYEPEMKNQTAFGLYIENPNVGRWLLQRFHYHFRKSVSAERAEKFKWIPFILWRILFWLFNIPRFFRNNAAQ